MYTRPSGALRRPIRRNSAHPTGTADRRYAVSLFYATVEPCARAASPIGTLGACLSVRPAAVDPESVREGMAPARSLSSTSASFARAPPTSLYGRRILLPADRLYSAHLRSIQTQSISRTNPPPGGPAPKKAIAASRIDPPQLHTVDAASANPDAGRASNFGAGDQRISRRARPVGAKGLEIPGHRTGCREPVRGDACHPARAPRLLNR